MDNSLLNSMKISLETAQFYEGDENWNYRNINSPFARIYLFTEGNGIAEYLGKRYKLETGYIHIIPSRILVNFSSPGPMKQFYIHFKAELAPGLDIFRIFAFEYKVRITSPTFERMLIERLVECSPCSLIHEQLEAEGLLRVLLSRFIKKENVLKSPELLRGLKKFRKVLAYIEKNIREDMSLEGLARIVNLQPTYFSNLFSSTMGMPPFKYINARRIEKAQTLLLGSDVSIKEAAALSGFNDLFYFSRVFRKYTGLPPASYRKQKLDEIF